MLKKKDQKYEGTTYLIAFSLGSRHLRDEFDKMDYNNLGVTSEHLMSERLASMITRHNYHSTARP